MDISAGIQASLAGRYAVALFELAAEEGVVSAVESDLDKLSAALDQSPEFAGLTTNPQLGRKVKMDAIAKVAGLLELTPLTLRFVGVLAENRRLAELPRIIRAFRDIAAAQRGEVSAEVISAHPLSEDQLSALKTKLTAREGRTVKLTSSVDPEMLGGLIVTIGSKRIDGSIRTRLNALTQAMKG
ncbi:F0F1 ATP synthase subunit delta [Alteriqipengyuania lutimaris]|uniref:ATP synthase subunit delta n=1 Tax=Alteriqipengyuania lutimaris TaxID=1538146 RepID=A0A395LH03_9SPHN|nr:F0F1 ATP synthase subunit delta [Alteriqipengyuania lutimaris]MBB3035526.1 F-type H+-transporting ATPase subunit delta [Alteriqipengyuania lutimaris]RDS76082.1 F0F1 ATP synthase subunit delta [Alteriqipengyuania lutimaris]